MSIRDTLISQATSALASTSVGVSAELPWQSGNQPLHEKNMKTVYFDELNQNITQLHQTLGASDVYQTETTVNALLTVDAKTQPSDIQTVVSALSGVRGIVTNAFISECEVTVETNQDRITYTFEYRFVTVN